MGYGGRHQRSFEEYHAIPAGWDAASVLAEHAALRGTHVISTAPVPDHWAVWFKYRQILYAVADGVRTRDAACVELAVRFIELHFIGSCSGFVRALLARRLKHVVLSESQRCRLHAHFCHLVVTGERSHEFKQYLRLWRMNITPADKSALVAQVRRQRGEAAAGWIAARLELRQSLIPPRGRP